MCEEDAPEGYGQTAAQANDERVAIPYRADAALRLAEVLADRKELRMPDWILQINAKLDELGLYPALEAKAVQGNAGVVVLEETQNYTAYRSPEGVYRMLSLLGVGAEGEWKENFEAVMQALNSNVVQEEDIGIEWNSVEGYHVV